MQASRAAAASARSTGDTLPIACHLFGAERGFSGLTLRISKIPPRFPIHGRSEADIRKMVYGGLDAECVVSIQLAGDVQLMDIFIPRMLARLPGEDGESCRQRFLHDWMQSERASALTPDDYSDR